MSRALLEHADEPPRPRGRHQVPYEPHEWDRKLAEARAKREAALKQRSAEREEISTEGSGTPKSVRDALTTVAAPAHRPPSAQETEPRDPAATSDPAWRRSLPMFIAGCMAGAVVMALIVFGVRTVYPAPELHARAPETTASPGTPITAAMVGQAEPGRETGAIPMPGTPVRSEPVAPDSTESDSTRMATAPAPESLPSRASQGPSAAEPTQEASPPPSAGGATGAPAAPPDRPQLEIGAVLPASKTAEGTGPAAGLASDAAAAVMIAAPADEAPARPPGDTAAATADVPAPGAGWAELAAAPLVAPAPADGQVSPLAASASRVVVLAPRSVPRGAREEAAALLRERGWPAQDPRSSPFTISTTHVRYYHAADRPAAEELAALFSADARDFTGYARRPETGMLELWLAGRAPARRVQPTRPALPPPLQAVADALGRLAQGGGHRN